MGWLTRPAGGGDRFPIDPQTPAQGKCRETVSHTVSRSYQNVASVSGTRKTQAGFTNQCGQVFIVSAL